MVSCNGGLNQMRAAVSCWWSMPSFAYDLFLGDFGYVCIWWLVLYLYVLQICDMVAIARYLNVTLIVPELDKASFWADPRCVNFSLFTYLKLMNVSKF